ncbi:hypothetical protein ADT71_23815 [Novosphingobium sp. ST904]|nr:hypothetical protein ADT71_23815 [Novosphingobium sp. ST904]
MRADPRPPDADLNHTRSLAALEALKSLFESLPLGTEIRSEHIAALLDVTLAVARTPASTEPRDLI